MGKTIVIKGADFSAVALAKTNLFDISQVRRNYAVYALSNSADTTVMTYNGFCVCGYIEVPAGASKIKLSGIQQTGAVRYRFSKTQSDSEAVPQGTGLSGVYIWSSSVSEATVNVPSDSDYKYFIATVYRYTSGTSSQNETAASNADLTGVSIEAIF